MVDCAPSMPGFLHLKRGALLAACALVLAACGTTPPKPGAPAPGAPPASSKYYKDDGPGEAPPANLDQVPDAVPRLEPLHRFANRPYTVMGREYVPATSLAPYRSRERRRGTAASSTASARRPARSTTCSR